MKRRPQQPRKRTSSDGRRTAVLPGRAELREAPVRGAQRVLFIDEQVLELHVQAHHALRSLAGAC
jgi:hypothetical protein